LQALQEVLGVCPPQAVQFKPDLHIHMQPIHY